MRISLVVAMTRRGVIGKDGALPWSLPRDLKRFREVTWGKPIVMGRRTHESLGRPLPGRLNIVLTRHPDDPAPGCEVVGSVADALKASEARGASELMVIGGRQVYEAFLPICRTVHLTLIEQEVDGDTTFPVDFLGSPDWEAVHRESWPADARNPIDAIYYVLNRRESPPT